MSPEVGFGRGVITPPLPVMLAGFTDRSTPATAVHDDLEARAVVIRGSGLTLCLLVCDLLGLSVEFADPIRTAVAAAIGTEPGYVLTSSTHTHAAPSTMAAGELLGWPTPAGYLELLVDGCVTAARAAAAAARPASLSYARGPLPAELSLNRRGLPYDPTVALLDVVGDDGVRVGTIANIAIHPVALGVSCTSVATDWVGPFRTTCEAATGAPVVALSGALGDVNPTRDPHTHPEPGGNLATAAQLGADVAAVIAELLPSAHRVGDELRAIGVRFDAPVGDTLLSQVTGRAGATVEVELVEWDLGGIAVVALPGEAFHELGRAVETSRGERALLAGLAPVWQGYLPSPFTDGYEESVSYGEPFVDAVRQRLLGGMDPMVVW